MLTLLCGVGIEVLSALGLAVGVHLSLYPAMLVCPLLIIAHKVSCPQLQCLWYSVPSLSLSEVVFWVEWCMEQ